MTTAHGHGGITTIGPQHPHRWMLILALLAITAVGLAAVALIANQSLAPTASAPEAGPDSAPVAPEGASPLLDAPMNIQELRLVSEAATGLVPTGIYADEMLLLGLTTEQTAEINHLLAHPSTIATGDALDG